MPVRNFLVLSSVHLIIKGLADNSLLEIPGVEGSIVTMRRTRAAMRRGVRKMKMTERRGMKRGRRKKPRLSIIMKRDQSSNRQPSRHVENQWSTCNYFHITPSYFLNSGHN